MSRTLRNAWALVTHPRMAAKYGAWLTAKLTGRACATRLPGGGSVAGFRRFSDYWTLNVPSPAEFNLLRRTVTPGGVVADVGANIGAFAVTLARLAPAGKVLAFEPSPDTARTLRANVERNGLTNVEVIPAAVSDGPGRLRFTDDRDCTARNHIVPGAAPAGPAVIEVDAVTLDQVCADRGVRRLDFVKTDTEGAEARVVRGAAGLLRDRRVGAMLVEVCPAYLADMGSSAADLIAAVEGCGYAAFRLRPDGTAGGRYTAADLGRVAYDNVLVQVP